MLLGIGAVLQGQMLFMFSEGTACWLSESHGAGLFCLHEDAAASHYCVHYTVDNAVYTTMCLWRVPASFKTLRCQSLSGVWLC